MAYLETKSFDEIFSFTRPTSKWVFNQQGQLVEVPAGQPAFEYDPVTGEPKGILIEEQRTNLFRYSENFDQSVWLKSNLTISSNAAIAPDGNMSADKLVEDTENASHTIHQPVSVTSGTTYTISMFLKAAERNIVRLSAVGAFGNSSVTVSLVDGSVSDGLGKTEYYGNGWWRVSLPTTSTSDGAGMLYIAPRITTGGGSSTYLGDGASGIYIWGAQIEEGSFPTSYIPTSNTQVTRASDRISIEDLTPWFNPNEGTFIVEWEVGALISTSGVIFSVGSATNDRLMLQVLGDGRFAFVQDSSVSSIVTSGLPSATMRVALSYSVGSPSKWSYNGLPTTTVSTNKLPFLTDPVVAIGDRSWALGTDTYTGKFKLVKYEPHAVSDEELQELSSL